jgi:rubrerythrin
MAQSTFNDLEALRISINIEKRGERFYKAAAQKLDDPDVKDMLNELAVQESEHAETFRMLYDQALENKEYFDDSYLFDPDVSAYFYAMVESTIFPNEKEQDEVIDRIQNVKDVLKIGIQAEKESILFYTEMVIYSKYVEAKDAFRKLLQEEKSHLINLQGLLAKYED